jgi:hypothetical protein
MSIQDEAREAESWFVWNYRVDTGERFTKCQEGRPNWLQDMIRELHGDMLPDDYKYSAVLACLEHIAESSEDDEPGDIVNEWADSYVDHSTHALTGWLHSSVERPGYVDQYCDDYGTQPGSEFDRLQAGQLMEHLEIGAAVANALAERAEMDNE